MFTSQLQAEAGGHRGHDLNNRGESHLYTSATGRSNFGVNLPANFSLARFINIRSNSFTRPCHRGRAGARIPRAANIPFLNSLLQRRAFGSRPNGYRAKRTRARCEPLNTKTISTCYEG